MGRGKIEIKKIENPTNRQVTYSKRRVGLMKKARELTVLCDAQVSLLMVSSTNKIDEYCSPTTETKDVFEKYQQATGINLWNAKYERMQNALNHLKGINQKLRLEMRQRMGESLEGLNMEELRGLEQSVDEALKLVRQRKYHVICTQTDTYKKKLKSSHEAHGHLLQELAISEEQQAALEEYVYGAAAAAAAAVEVVDDDVDPAAGAGRSYEEAMALANAAHLLAFRVQQHHTATAAAPELRHVLAGFEMSNYAASSHDLRLA